MKVMERALVIYQPIGDDWYFQEVAWEKAEAAKFAAENRLYLAEAIFVNGKTLKRVMSNAEFMNMNPMEI